MNNQPLISIIMPCYNASKNISKSIDSVLNQNYTNWELLITDDCSTDNSRSIVESFCKIDKRVKLYTLKKNMGVANARNNSISLSKGTYIAFLDSDDMWDSKKLDTQITYMVKNNFNFSYTAYQKINNDDVIISDKIKVRESGTSYYNLLKHNEIGCLTVVLKKELLNGKQFDKVGHEDYVLWLSILKSGVNAFGLNEPLAYYRVGNESLSSNKIQAAKYTWHIFRDVERLGFIRSCFFFSNYALNSFLKSLK